MSVVATWLCFILSRSSSQRCPACLLVFRLCLQNPEKARCAWENIFGHWAPTLGILALFSSVLYFISLLSGCPSCRNQWPCHYVMVMGIDLSFIGPLAISYQSRCLRMPLVCHFPDLFIYTSWPMIHLKYCGWPLE